MKSITLNGKEFIISGKLLSIIRLKEEWDCDVEDPEEIVKEIREAKVKADLFTFSQRLPNITPLFNYPLEWDNVAAIPISTYEHWWTKQVYQQVRNHVRKSIKLGVSIKEVPFDDNLIKGINEIFNETPIRQGTPNTHYGKTFEETKKLMSTYLDRSIFIGAFCNNEMIGFLKLVFTNNFARTMGIEGKISHRDKRAMNALIAKAVELCAKRGVKYLVYGKFIYGKKGIDSLAKFKQSNGFEQINLPRYYIPITLKGKIGLFLRLYKRPADILPGFLVRLGIKIRSLFYELKYRKYLRSFKEKNKKF